MTTNRFHSLTFESEQSCYCERMKQRRVKKMEISPLSLKTKAQVSVLSLLILVLLLCDLGNANSVIEYTATMSLYRDSSYSTKLTNPSLKTNQKLYIEISTDLSPSGEIKLVLEHCWATPSPSPSDTNRIILIAEPGCATHSVSTQITENGKENFARFNHQVFKYRTSSTITTHCVVALCTNNCEPTCSKRRRRKRQSGADVTETISTTYRVVLDEPEPHELLPQRNYSVSPTLENITEAPFPRTEPAKGLDGTTLVIIAVVLAAVVVMAGIMACAILHCRLKKSKERKERKQRNVEVYSIVHPAYTK